LTPDDPAGRALARAHRLYAGFVNARARQTRRLFQGRFGSVAMDEDHLMAAAGAVALNPVPAGPDLAASWGGYDRHKSGGSPGRPSLSLGSDYGPSWDYGDTGLRWGLR
jgi:putative transposase